MLCVKTKRELVMEKRGEILALAEKYGLTDLRVFGSVARGDERPESDVDFLVRRKPHSDAYLVFGFKEEVTRLLGCKVDVLVEQRGMKPRLRERVVSEAM